MMRAGMAQLVRRPTYHQLDGELRKVSAVMNTQTVGNHDLLENTRRSKCIKRKAMIKKILENLYRRRDDERSKESEMGNGQQ